MDIYCEHCRKVTGRVADDKIPADRQVRVTCPVCKEKIVIGQRVASTPPPIPTAPLEGAVLGASGTDDPLPKPSSVKESGPGEIQDYDFEVWVVIREAWEKTSGVKGTLWAAAFLVLGVVIVTTGILSVLGHLIGAAGSGFAYTFAAQLTLTAAIYPFLAGIMMIGIHRSVNLPVNSKMVFGYFVSFVPLVIGSLLVSVMTTIGFFILLIPGIYLSIAYLMVIPLIVEREMQPWQAMEFSRKTVQRHWFKVFGLYILMTLIYMLSAIPLGLGMIWTMPMFVMVNGILYREMFGVRAAG
ncbi:MAG: hypothetical protein KJ950_08870 [Proteobacteria bacterium]|nr:hypothetical protein [Pseudomonadota bacterium]MBU1686605.1 hypothetical protein [Pseudomonadota bacterium]